ncbi:hypothetical protein ST47_g9968 [Ascochyta rabiei]|uniref:Uncharacterized protein n=1 Tax=Didymella rabiei TaxID=5454 RepID=A0A162W998_DIDRA|nr:hypothetical protein ST47_g9968 [Ascochyta rabiei]
MSNVTAATILSMRMPDVELASVAEASRLSLLDLPGSENPQPHLQVAVEGESILLRHATDTPRKKPYKDRLKARQQSFGLTQACRHMRLEYLPLYRAQTKVTCRVHPCEVYDYIETFLMRPGIEDEEVTGALIIDLHTRFPQSINIKPLLQLSKIAQYLSVHTKGVCRFQGWDVFSGTLEELVVQILGVENKSNFYG